MDGELNCNWSSFILWEKSSRYYINDVIICAVNAFTAVFAFLCNLVIIVTTKRKNLIQTPCDILIGSLTLLECAAPLVANPLFTALRMSLHDDHMTCSRLHQLTKATELAIVFCCGCSFTHIVLIAGDRYFALHKPIRYRRPCAKKGEEIETNTIRIHVFFNPYKQRVLPATIQVRTLSKSQRQITKISRKETLTANLKFPFGTQRHAEIEAWRRKRR